MADDRRVLPMGDRAWLVELPDLDDASLVIVLWCLGLPLALVVRLVTFPARGAIRRWLAWRDAKNG